MAAEAVIKIKEAEEKGSELIKNATEKAKEIIRKAESDGIELQKTIISEAGRTHAGIIDAAVRKAEDETAGLVHQAETLRGALQAKDGGKFESAVNFVVNFVTERTVNPSGNS